MLILCLVFVVFMLLKPQISVTFVHVSQNQNFEPSRLNIHPNEMYGVLSHIILTEHVICVIAA